MKKSVFILFLVIFSSYSLNSQSVDSIKVEQSGDLIKIHYKILNSTHYQTFKIAVSAKINGGLESKLESLIGDVGENVLGGKEEYMIIWDALKDVDEVNSAEFSVKAELISDNTPKRSGKINTSDPVYWQKERFFLIASGAIGSDYFLGGGRIGYMGNFGFSFSALFGNKPYPDGYTKDGDDSYQSTGASIDLTKRIVNNKNNQLHILGGIAISDQASTSANNYQGSMRWGIDLGLVAGINRLALYAGFSKVKPSFFSDLDSEGTAWFNIGFGIRF
jgi:hypothetical protein